MSKAWICELLTVVVLFCGCGKETNNARVKGETVESQSKTVKLETSMGDILIELDLQAAPVTTKNFLAYVEAGFYDGTIFHRVIPDFMIQGGGYTADLERKDTRSPIANEASNALSNMRGTIAMARTSNPDSATSQFFINHANNAPLDYVSSAQPGYAVFGKVVEGLDVVDAIASVKTTTQNDMKNVPAEPVVIKSASVLE